MEASTKGPSGLGCGALKSGGAESWPARGSAAGSDVHHGVQLKNLPGTRGQARAANMERGLVGMEALSEVSRLSTNSFHMFGGWEFVLAAGSSLLAQVT